MIRAFLLATRPKTLPAAVVPVWVGCVLAWKLSGNWSAKLAVATLLGAVFIQIATNFFNDAIDAAKGADTEKRLGPKRVTASGLLSRRTVMMCGAFFLVLAFVCGVVLYQAAGWPILAIGVPSLYLAFGCLRKVILGRTIPGWKFLKMPRQWQSPPTSSNKPL